MRRSFVAVLLLGSFLGIGVPASAKTFDDGVFTRAQAKDGEDLFDAHCGTCHETDYFRPVFGAWAGESLASFFDVMAATMPQSNPGSLANADYVRILSYILDENDFPRGDEPLNEYARGFDAITVSAPK